MDLFGNLPSVKNPKKRSSDQTSSSCKLPDHQEPCPNDAATINQSGANTEKKKSRSSTGVFSLVNTIGTVGTTRGFLPSALLRKTSVPTEPAGVHAASKQKSLVGNSAIATANIESSSKLPQKDSENLIGKQDEQEISTLETRSHEQEEGGGESEELRLLHESVTDPYDPFCPNDYLEYCEEKRREIERKELEKSTREALHQQQIIREQIVEERRKMIEIGDYQSVVSSVRNREHNSISDTEHNGRGRGVRNLPAWLLNKQQQDTSDSCTPNSDLAATSETPARIGRGRGLNNLPAWLLKRQQEEEENTTFSTPGTSSEHKSDITTSLRCVALYNLTAPGAIDEDLSDEVKEECEMQCGPVNGKIVVKDADVEHPQVRVFVLFQNSIDAQKASKLFDGRSFGGRQISAALIEERDFHNL